MFQLHISVKWTTPKLSDLKQYYSLQFCNLGRAHCGWLISGPLGVDWNSSTESSESLVACLIYLMSQLGWLEWLELSGLLFPHGFLKIHWSTPSFFTQWNPWGSNWKLQHLLRPGSQSHTVKFWTHFISRSHMVYSDSIGKTGLIAYVQDWDEWLEVSFPVGLTGCNNS